MKPANIIEIPDPHNGAGMSSAALSIMDRVAKEISQKYPQNQKVQDAEYVIEKEFDNTPVCAPTLKSLETKIVKQLKPYPGCPTLSWMIAKRVTDPYEVADAFISFTGRKGSSKSTSSAALCEAIAADIALLRGRGEKASKFFNITHVRSISETGALELLSSGILQKENSVILLDDTGTQWGSRNFQSAINKHLNSILQICRIYRCVIVANFIMANHVDVQARQMTDFRAQMLYKNVKAGQAVFKFFYIEQGERMGKGREYKKYLRWHGKRITKWVIGRPSRAFEKAYQKMRKENTRELVENGTEIMRKIEKERGKGDPTCNGAIHATFTSSPEFPILRAQVMAIRNDPQVPPRQKTSTAIARVLKSTRYRVELAGDF